jgi:outer membrane lipoprotein-sorting protein
MKPFKLLILILAVFFSFAFIAEKNGFQPLKDVETFKVKIQEYAEETNTIQSDFLQEKRLSMLEEVMISKGHFTFKKENNVRWEYVDPIDYAIIVQEGKFTIWDGEKIQAFDIESNRMFTEINNMIVTSVSGNFLNKPDFESTFFENKNFYLVRLIPNNQEVRNMLSSIEIYFEKGNIAVSKVKFQEPGEDYTLISFTNRRTNEELPEEIFNMGFNK